MFWFAVLFNSFLLFAMAIYFLIKVFGEKSDLKKLRKLVLIYFILNFINGYASGMIDIGFEMFVLFGFFITLLIIHIVTFFVIRKKLKQSDDIDYIPMSIRKFIVLTIIPIIIIVVPFVYELNILNDCEYIIKFNYQSGFISEDTYIAIVNNVPKKVTLKTDILKRERMDTEELYYSVTYGDEIQILKGDNRYNKIAVDEEDIKKVALDAHEKCPSAKGAVVYYFPEGKYAFISLHEEQTHGTVLGEYFYYDGKYIQSAEIPGDVDEVIYYK